VRPCRHPGLPAALAGAGFPVLDALQRPSGFFVLTAAGTLCHELAHFGVGLLTNAEPVGLNLIPRRKGKVWELGFVTFANLRWYNAAPAALAPLLVLLLPLLVAAWRTRPGWHFEPLDAAGGIPGAAVPVVLAVPGGLETGRALLALAGAGVLALAAWVWRAQLPGLLPAF